MAIRHHLTRRILVRLVVIIRRWVVWLIVRVAWVSTLLVRVMWASVRLARLRVGRWISLLGLLVTSIVVPELLHVGTLVPLFGFMVVVCFDVDVISRKLDALYRFLPHI